MKHSILNKIKEQMKAVWEDIKSPGPYMHGTSCCSYGPTPFKTELRPEPIRIKNNFNNKYSRI